MGMAQVPRCGHRLGSRALLRSCLKQKLAPWRITVLDVASPIEGALLRRLPMTTLSEIAAAVSAARGAASDWRGDYASRARAVHRFRDSMVRDVDDLALTLTLETGK